MPTLWDVIIVGAGTSGIPAAIKLSERGAKVLVVEAANEVGGTLHLSVGSFSGAGSKLQEAKGIVDTPEKHFEESNRINHGTGDTDKMKLWQENAADTLDWLMDMGLQFPKDQPVVSMGHEPYETARVSTPQDRGHGYLSVLKKQFDEVLEGGSMELRLETRMTDILTNEKGSVVGIRVDNPEGESEDLHASTIVLASGGYAYSDNFWKEFHNRPKRVYANKHSLGDGLKVARKIGAQIKGIDNLIMSFGATIDIDNPVDHWIHTCPFPDQRPPWEIYVNQDGRRFINEETASQDFRERTIMNQPDWCCWFVYDQAIKDEAPDIFSQMITETWSLEKVNRAFDTHPDYVKAHSIEDLASQTGMPEASLRATITQYNKGRKAKSDPWGRKHTPLPIQQPPFYAIKHYAFSTVAFGGIACDNELRVLARDGTPIPNLYACGEILGFGLWGNAFLGGCSIGGCLTMGRLIGERFVPL